jgi:hypothetical protein
MTRQKARSIRVIGRYGRTVITLTCDGPTAPTTGVASTRRSATAQRTTLSSPRLRVATGSSVGPEPPTARVPAAHSPGLTGNRTTLSKQAGSAMISPPGRSSITRALTDRRIFDTPSDVTAAGLPARLSMRANPASVSVTAAIPSDRRAVSGTRPRRYASDSPFQANPYNQPRAGSSATGSASRPRAQPQTSRRSVNRHVRGRCATAKEPQRAPDVSPVEDRERLWVSACRHERLRVGAWIASGSQAEVGECATGTSRLLGRQRERGHRITRVRPRRSSQRRGSLALNHLIEVA